MVFKAVIFDIGGVVLRSPFIGIAEYELEHGLAENYINGLIMASGPSGAWQRFERGELELFSFYDAFTKDLSNVEAGNTWYRSYCQQKGINVPRLPENLSIQGRELFGRMMRGGHTYDPHIYRAIQHLRTHGKHKLIALTNNFSRNDIPHSERVYLGWENGATQKDLVDLFDDFCDSSVLGMRKPDPGFYLLACQRNGIEPQDAVFLDDIRINLKTAQRLGMATIHVPIGQTLAAVKQLEDILGMDLTSLGTTASKL